MAIKSVRELFQDNGKSNKTTTRGFTSVRDLYATEENLKPFYESFQSALTNWSTANTEYYKSVEDYYKNLDQSSYGLESASKWKNDVSTRNQWLLDEADRLNKVLDDYGRYFDSATIADIRKMFGDTRKGLNSILTQADTDIDYWSQFKDEGDYHNYYFGNKYKNFTYAEADEAWRKTEGKESDWIYNNLDNFKSSAELQAEIDALNKDYDLDAPYLVQALKHGIGDVYDWLDSGVDEGTREWARNEKARLTELKAKATKKEEDQQFLTDFLPSELNPEIKTPDFAEYVEKGKSKGKKKGDWDGPFVQGYESDIIAIKEGKLTASGDWFYQKFANAMDDDQYNKYAYLFGKHGKKVADKYLRYIEPEIDAKEGKRMKELVDAPVLDELFHVFANLERWAGDIGSIGSDEYKAPSAVQIADQMLGAEKKGLEKVLWDVEGNIAYMMPSMLAGYATSAILGPAGYGVMGAKTAGAVGQAGLTGLSAYGAGRQEMLNLGYDEGQANMYGLLTGASEAGLQYLLNGIGKFSGTLTDDAVKMFTDGLNSAGAKFAIEFGADLAGEALEESLQEWLNPFFQKIATGKHESVDWKQVGYAGMLGALSAGVMNGVGAGVTRANERSLAKDIKKKDGWVDSVKNLGNTFSADTLAYKLAGKVTEKTSVGQLATLIHEMNGTLSEQNKADIKYQLMREGVMESDAETISKWLGKAVDGDTFTALQRKALDNNPIIQRVFKKVIVDQNSTVNQRLNALMELEGKDGHAGIDYSAIAKSQTKEALSKSATLNQFVKEAQTDAIKSKYNIGRPSVGNYDATLDNLVGKAKDAVSKAKVSESGVTTNSATGKQIDIRRVTETDGKNATFALSDGTTIRNKDVEYADNDEGLLYEGAISLGYDANITNAIIHGIEGVDLPVIKYLNGVDEAIEYGRIGYPMDKISTNGFYADLPDSMKTYAYNLGKESAKKDTAKAQAKIDANKGKVEKAREGEVVHLYEKSGLTSRQEASLTTLGKVVSDITHNKVYIFDTVEKTINGKKVRVFAKDTAGFKAGTPADNGFINKATGEIYIDLHAGMNGEGVILWTLAHELTHFVRQWSPAKFNVLADFLMAEYGKQGVDVQTLIDNKVANSRNKLTRDQAYEEVVADAMQTMFTDTDLASKLEKLKNKDKGLWNKIKAFFADLYKRIVGEYKGVDAQTDEAKKVREMSKDTIKRLSDLFAEGIVDAGDTFANLDVEGVMTDIANSLPSESTATTDPNSMVAHSYRSFAEACGFEAYEDPDASIRSWRFKGSANSVNEVTEHQIRNSPIGALINYSATKKYISYEDAQAQYKMFAEIANMCIKQQDFAQAMQFVGSMVFTGMKANADKQYKTTYDFPSICTKTQAVIDAMSDAMIKKGAGLTKAELEALYRKVWEMGNPVPRPECYVFSRWVGIGGLLDNIKKYQDTYSKMTMAEVESEYQKMKAEIEEFSKANGISFGKAKGKIFDLYAKEEAKLMEEIAKLEEAGDIVPQSKKDRLAKISLQKDTTKAMSWIHKVYFANESHTKVNPNYLVPNEVLFDLNAGETFATKYKEAWGFRTTQGAGYGKAITPYAEAVLGEGINVTNNTTKTIKGKANRDTSSPKSNIFLEQNGTLSNEAIRVLETARKKQLAQAFLGGQRLQSTSDARYENVTDYLIAAIEMQAMHSKAQVYTKVSGAVEAFNNWGFAINQSLMPLNSGLTKDGRLKDTSSGGMKVDVAYTNRTRFENAGTITIGVNDAHIRTLFRERGRDFIIPYHASGGDQTLIREFRRIQDSKAGNETFVQSCDYSKTQSEKELPTSLLRELGYTDEQIADVEKFREQRLAILTRYKAVDMEYIRAEGNEVLSRLYDEFNGGIWDGVKLTKDTVGTAIFPNEYWDKSVDYDHSSKITEDYLEYCHRLGFLHKFSGKSIQYNKNLQNHQLVEVMGYNENGERAALTDLAYIDGDPSKGVEQFYWKTLTDRRMYGNDGKYLEQKFVTLGNADASVAETFAKDNEGSVREYSKEKSDETLKTIKVENGKVSVADNMMMSERTEAPPTKTEKAYKLMRLVDGKLYPLFIGNNEEVKVGAWYNADSPNLSQLKNLAPGTHLVDMKTGEAITWDEYAEKHIPKKNGKPKRNKPNIDDVHWANDNGYRFMHIEEKAGGTSESRMLKQYGDTRAYYNWGVNGSSKTESGEGSASLYALRPGWHFGEVPTMHQIGYDGVDGDTVRLDNQVWVEVEMSADVDYNAEAASNWGGDIPTHIPTNGYYKFATNPTQKKTKGGNTEADLTKSDWYVAGAFKVNRILSDSEADSIVENYNKTNGKNVPLDFRRNYGRVFNAETMSLEDRIMYSERILMGSLFSGGGTLEAGLTYQMLDKQFGVEYDGKIASVYADNHGDHIQVGRVEDFDISKYKDIFYLHASPVCHNFSKAKHGAKELQMDIDSAKATAKHLETAMPQVFAVENAPGYRKSQSLKIITDKLTELGYKWDVDVYNSADYGSATSRNRVILRAIKDGELPAKPTKQSRTNSWDKVTRDLWNTLPKSSLRPSFISAIENTPSLPILDANGKVNVNKPLLILTTTNGHQVTYSWESEVCPTLTTKCGEAKLVMPDGNIYAVTPEFMGRIQGLPNDYKYPKEKTRAFTIIGNGIPTHLTKAVVGGVLDSAYEQTHNGDILYSERNSIPVDNRSLLANALESVAQSDVEREWISRYKSKIEELNDAQNKLAELRAEIHKIRFSKGQDRKKLPALETQADILAERINRADKKLLNLEASKPLQKVIDRERAKAYKLGMEKLANYRKERAESKALNYYRPRIEKIVSDLSNRLEHPSAKTAIPEAFGASVAKVLSAFNFTTYDKDGNIRPTKANVKRTEAKRDLETLAELLGQNTIEAEYGQLDIPPEMLEWIKSVATYFDAAENLATNEFDVNKMNEEQLKGAYKFLRSLQTAINNAGKYYTNAHYNVTDDARSTMEYVGELPTEVNETLQKASKMFKWDFASPVTVFDRFGEGGKHVYNMLVKGQSKMAYNVQEVLDFVEKAYTEKEAKEWREKLVTVEIGGEEFNVTVEMLMGLHCLLRQEDSKRHILEGGGIRFADVKNKGKVKRYENIFCNEIDAMAVEKALDEFPRAREVAEAMQKFMESTGSAWGNEVSMIRFGYHAFTTRNYYPIRTIAAGSEYEAQQKRANIYALLNKSFTKERNVKANNAVIVDGIFSVFNNHMAEMALYNAWALPVIDTIKWFNYQETQDIDAKKPEKSVHETFRLAYGTYADEYVRRLLESINSQTDGGLSEGFAFRQLRMVNRVAVSWNARVVIQQPFSLARAYELINPKYVTPLVGKAMNVAYEEMLANSGIAKWKSMGYYDVDVSRPLETQVMKNASVADKFTEVGMKGAEFADSLAWSALWNACKKETAEQNKGISNEELLKKTAERFDDVILRTQVVDSVLAKSQWMRSKNFLHRSTSAFMSEPLTSYNTLLRQADKFERDKAIHGVKYAVKNNAKGIAKVTSVFVFSQLLNALITAPLDALRDDDDYETYIEKLLANFKENAVGNLMPWNMMPWISDVADYFMYGRTDRSDMAYLVNLIDLSKSIYKLADNYSYYKLHNTFNKALAVASQTSGFAVSNIWRDAVAMWNAVAGELGYGELKFQVSEDTHSEGYKRMYDAIASGDTDRAGYLYGQLLSNGVDEDKIYNGLTKCVKEAFQDGAITEEEATKLLKEIIGFVGKTDSEGNPPTAEDIYWMIDRWKYTKKEGYSRYDDLYEAMENGDPTSALEWHIEKKTEAYLEEARREAEKDGKTFSETKAKREAKSKAESSVKSAISSYWKPKYKEAYKKGDTEEMKRIRYILRDTKLYGSVSDIIDTCKGWLKD